MNKFQSVMNKVYHDIIAFAIFCTIIEKKTFYHRYLKKFLILLLATPGAELQPESSLF